MNNASLMEYSEAMPSPTARSQMFYF